MKVCTRCAALAVVLLAATVNAAGLNGIWVAGDEIMMFKGVSTRRHKGYAFVYDLDTRDTIRRPCARSGERLYVYSTLVEAWLPFCIYRVVNRDTLMVKFATPALDWVDLEIAEDALFPKAFADGDTVKVYVRRAMPGRRRKKPATALSVPQGPLLAEQPD